MSATSRPVSADLGASEAELRAAVFDEEVRLSGPQLARLRAVGEVRWFAAGEVLLEPGELDYPFLLMGEGRVEAVRFATPDRRELVIGQWGPGEFAGEWGLITGEATFLAIRAVESGRLHEIPRERFLRVLSEDGELSRVVMRELVRRRQVLRVGEDAAGVEILGAAESAASYELRSWAEHQRIAFSWLDVDEPAGAALAHAIGCGREELPVVITPTATIRRASAGQLSENLGLAYRDASRTLDLVVVGAGPAGLAAGVYGASDGLSTLVLDAASIGGQAAASPRIENYLGYPDGISGEELTTRGVIQAQKFGATVSTPSAVDAVMPLDEVIRLHLADGTEIRARAVLIATGAKYRRLPLARWHDFEGASIFFAATEIEAEFCRGEPVVVVGGANSSGQAALFLASRASSVSLVVRHDLLEAGMSDYLARRIREHPRIDIHLGAEVTALHGRDHLRGVDVTPRSGGSAQELRCACLFCFIGATPATDWLDGVALDNRGFVLTGTDLTEHDLPPVWDELGRRPLPFETSTPRVFAAGDVRHGSIKRVAAAVGEGSSVLPSVHRAIATRIEADTAGPPAISVSA
ncbi:MAG TPA: FAD-dependent oxidoreductase [Solirubrobacteraceae bacterium]|nr:FAD-dependent oxidoreductase [Solirubrobacteraceae bacterium]